MGESSNRKKGRRLVGYKDFKRRIITDKKEIDQIKHEQADDTLRIKLEDKASQEAPRWDDTASSNAQNESMEAWTPPRTPREFYFLAKRTFPHWSDGEHWKWALRMQSRHRFLEKAVMEGLGLGRDLRERYIRKLGWWWPALGPLSNAEREFVMGFVRRKVCGDLLKATLN